jgi:hypothetical protein
MTPIDRAKEHILAELKKLPSGATELTIFSNEPSLPSFNQALESVEIQGALNLRGVRVSVRIPDPPIEQGKRFMLNFLATLPPSDEERHVVFPCIDSDERDCLRALASIEVQSELRRRNLTASIQVQSSEKPSPEQQIVIAAFDDMASGKLDYYFKYGILPEEDR